MSGTLFDMPRRPGRPRKLSVADRYAQAIAAAVHLRGEDVALAELGRRLALELDAVDEPKLVAQLAAQMLAITDRLGLSPQARARLNLDASDEEVNPLDDLALIRAARRGDAGP